MLVTVRLFAMLRERAGADTLELELPEPASVADVLDRVQDIAAGIPLVLAVNRVYADRAQALAPGDELALIPPVSGGDWPPHVRVTAEPLSIDALAARVGDDGAGAIVVFAGVTREVAALDYEAYVEMAAQRIEAIAAAALAHHGALRAAVEHRTGTVALGEPSVVVAASAAHRDEAFAAAREIIDEVKAQAPVWKRERDGDWIEGHEPQPPR